ncbi:C1 family peptidase [Sphingosinithalassobacter sp. CS137]|uniref:C1 family peptidase n=1 Tax=Sphingosinithalassobacter sp. CS137 TaxID=2762748 RepID=UPI0021CEEBED|nr:C1 family peptidase [Sphingosinithalassobacter sp. CS137]
MSIVVSRDLASAFGGARDQGARPTCLAFASSDCHAATLGPWEPLSCEWIYHSAQARSGRSHFDGATLGSMLEALRHDGQPVESEWPYQQMVVEPWTPPAGSPTVFRAVGETTTADVDAVVALLESGRPAVMLMTLSRSFYLPDSDGVVRAAADELPDPAVRHAVVATAHGVVDGRSAVRVRNSWGTGWGADGSAWLDRDFLAARLFAAFGLLGVEDVSAD